MDGNQEAKQSIEPEGCNGCSRLTIAIDGQALTFVSNIQKVHPATSKVKSAVRSFPSCWNCPHALCRPGLGKFARKETDGPPHHLAAAASTSSAG
jgi:hypothetical protein